MAPFKEYFIGNGQPPNDRIADEMLRVSEHNDLEEVGYDATITPLRCWAIEFWRLFQKRSHRMGLGIAYRSL